MGASNIIGGLLQGLAKGREEWENEQLKQEQADLQGIRSVLKSMAESNRYTPERTQEIWDTYLETHTGKAKPKQLKDRLVQLSRPEQLPDTEAGAAPPAQTNLPANPNLNNGPAGAIQFPGQPPAQLPISEPVVSTPGSISIPPMLQTPTAPPFEGPAVAPLAAGDAYNRSMTTKIKEDELRLRKEYDTSPDRAQVSMVPPGTKYAVVNGQLVPVPNNPDNAKQTNALVEKAPGKFDIVQIDPANPPTNIGKIWDTGAAASAEWKLITTSKGGVAGILSPSKHFYGASDLQAIPEDGRKIVEEAKKAQKIEAAEAESKSEETSARTLERQLTLLDAREQVAKRKEIRTLEITTRKRDVLVRIGNKIMGDIEKRPNKAVTGPEFLALLGTHIGNTLGQPGMGTRISQALIFEHIRARPLGQQLEALTNKLVNGGNVSLAQIRQWVDLANESRFESWRAIKEAADAAEVEFHPPSDIKLDSGITSKGGLAVPGAPPVDPKNPDGLTPPPGLRK